MINIFIINTVINIYSCRDFSQLASKNNITMDINIIDTLVSITMKENTRYAILI